MNLLGLFGDDNSSRLFEELDLGADSIAPDLDSGQTRPGSPALQLPDQVPNQAEKELAQARLVIRARQVVNSSEYPSAYARINSVDKAVYTSRLYLKYMQELVRKFSNTPHFKLLTERNLRRLGALNLDTSLGYETRGFKPEFWNVVKGTNVTVRKSLDRLVATAFAIRKLGLKGFDFSWVGEKSKFKELGYNAAKSLKYVDSFLPAVYADSEAWSFLLRMQAAVDLGIALDEVDATICQPEWEMDAVDANLEPYQFEEIKAFQEAYGPPRKFSESELLQCDNSFAKLWGIYEIVKENPRRINDYDILSMLGSQPPERRVKFAASLAIQDGQFKDLAKLDKQKLLENLRNNPPVAALPKTHRLRDTETKDLADYIKSNNLQLFQNAIVEHPTLSEKLQSRFKDMGCAFLDAQEQQELLDTLEKLPLNYPSMTRDQFEATLFTFIDCSRISFTEDARRSWSVDNRLHFILYYASAVPLLRRGLRLGSRFQRNSSLNSAVDDVTKYNFFIPTFKLRKVDPATVTISSDTFIGPLRLAQKHLKKHLNEISGICEARAQKKQWQISNELHETIEQMDVIDPIKCLLRDLVNPYLVHESGFMNLSDYIRARCGMRLGVPIIAVPSVVGKLNQFAFNGIPKVDDSTQICGDEDQIQLRNKIAFRSKLFSAASTEFINTGLWIADLKPHTSSSIEISIDLARNNQIEDEVIEQSVKDLLRYFNIKIPPKREDRDFKKWFLQVRSEMTASDILLFNESKHLNEPELSALSQAVVSWKTNEFTHADCSASGKITQAVPCFFIQCVANSDKRLIFPWCALMSDRGLEAVVRSSPSCVEQEHSKQLLQAALGEDVDLDLCMNKGLSLDPAELYSLMRHVADGLKDGNKVCLLAQFIKQESHKIGNVRSGSGRGGKTFDWKKKDDVIRHPGLLISNEPEVEKRKKIKTATPHKKVQDVVLDVPAVKASSSAAPTWTQSLFSDGSYLYDAANDLIQRFAHESFRYMDEHELLEVETRKLLPTLQRFDSIVLPEGDDGEFHLSLRDYQKRSVRRCLLWQQHGVNGILCLDTGLGKTRIACELLLQKQIGCPSRPCLVITPNAVKAQWESEYSGAITIIDKPQDLERALVQKKTGVLVCADSQVLNLIKDEKGRELINQFRPSLIVLDEAHQLLTMTAGGKQKEFIKLLECWTDGRKNPVVALTATPIVNQMSDCVSLLSMINPNVITANSMHRFELAMDLVKRGLQTARKIFEEMPDNFELDLQIAGDTSVKGALFNLLCLKEMMIDPLLEKVTWEDEELQRMPREDMPVVRMVKKIICPTDREKALLDKIAETYKSSFLEKTHHVDLSLVHPDLEELGFDCVIQKFSLLNPDEQLAYLSESSTLKAVFVDSESELSGAIARSEKALVFVKHKQTAAFMRQVVQARYGLDDSSVFVYHSDVADREAVINEFKQITDRSAVLILLPKSGGTGLNFTDVSSNIMLTTAWTYEKNRQAMGRIVRGVGEKVIVRMRHEIPQRKHLLNIVRKKRHIDQLLLPSKNDNLEQRVLTLLKTGEDMVASEEKNAVGSPEWSAFFKQESLKFARRFSENARMLECEYLERRAQAFISRVPECAKDLFGYVLDDTSLVAYHLIPMPTNTERKPLIRALQIGLLQAMNSDFTTLDPIVQRMEQEQSIQLTELELVVRTNVALLNVGNTPDSCFKEAEELGLAVTIYEWANGVWGTYLMPQALYAGVESQLRILKQNENYYIMVASPQRHRSFH